MNFRWFVCIPQERSTELPLVPYRCIGGRLLRKKQVAIERIRFGAKPAQQDGALTLLPVTPLAAKCSSILPYGSQPSSQEFIVPSMVVLVRQTCCFPRGFMVLPFFFFFFFFLLVCFLWSTVFFAYWPPARIGRNTKIVEYFYDLSRIKPHRFMVTSIFMS